MAKGILERFARVEFAPPRYLAPHAAGIDISTSGLKVALIAERFAGLELVAYGEERLPPGAVTSGEIADRAAVLAALRSLAKKHHIRQASVALSESMSYLFETETAGATKENLRAAVERRLDEYVPLPPAEVSFDIVEAGQGSAGTRVVGIGYARRLIETSLDVLDEAGIEVDAIEGETFSTPRALLPYGDDEAVLIIDLGRTTTKIVIAVGQVPHFATTLDVGGHALTLAVQKHFGVTEEEAKRVKAERGLVGGENDEYVAAMLSTVSVIREEIVRRLEYWQTRATASGQKPVTRAILAGGNATVRGLPEYLETTLKIPVEQGDVFKNLAPRDAWLPPLDYTESLAYATAIGLALRNFAP